MASILAVDDEAGILDMIQSILRKDGHSVTGITRAEEIDYTKVGSFDLILLDIMMPGIDGFTLCKKIEKSSGLPDTFSNCKIRRKQPGKRLIARRRRLYLQAFWRYGVAGKNFRPFATGASGTFCPYFVCRVQFSSF